MNNFFNKDSVGDHIWGIAVTVIMFILFSGILGLYLDDTIITAFVSGIAVLGLRALMGKVIGELVSFNFAREIITVTIGVIILILVK